MIWQKSRTLWQAGGDKNTKYFHQVVKRNRQRNNITGIQHLNCWIEEPTHFKNIFLNHFNSFLSNDNTVPIFRLQSLPVNSLPNHIKDSLERPFSEEEISIALKESDSNKSPGPDGLNVGCLKHCWS